MKTKLYLIIWGTANVDDHGAASTYCGCEKYFYSKTKALKALTEYKDAFVKSLFEDADEDERAYIEDTLYIYGSEQEEYYEIDYTIYDCPSEHYVRLQEIEIF